MDHLLSYAKPSTLHSLPIPVKNSIKSSTIGILSASVPSLSYAINFSGNRRCGRPYRTADWGNRRALVAVASAEASRCNFSSLNAPLEPKSSAGKFLGGVLQNDRECFPAAVVEQLEQMAADRKEALARVNLSSGSSEECLHRRIAELKEQEYQTAVEDIIYMSIFYKFSEIRVHLVPRLSRCVYNGRLEIWPSRDFELESIHSLEVLEMIREHLTTVVGWKANSNVTRNWATTEIHRLHLCKIYAASIVYGYFLKSASLRHRLELCLSQVNYDLGVNESTNLLLPESMSCGLQGIALGHVNRVRSTSVGQELRKQGKAGEKLRKYVMGFDLETFQMCAKPKSKEAINLIERHSCALFGVDKRRPLETDELISTSVSSLKRLVLEAVAFGSFLWDAEDHVGSVYKLKEN